MAGWDRFLLTQQPRHCYSILKDVEEMSGGRVVLSTGTLYGALRRLPGNGGLSDSRKKMRPAIATRIALRQTGGGFCGWKWRE